MWPKFCVVLCGLPAAFIYTGPCSSWEVPHSLLTLPKAPSALDAPVQPHASFPACQTCLKVTPSYLILRLDAQSEDGIVLSAPLSLNIPTEK